MTRPYYKKNTPSLDSMLEDIITDDRGAKPFRAIDDIKKHKMIEHAIDVVNKSSLKDSTISETEKNRVSPAWRWATCIAAASAATVFLWFFSNQTQTDALLDKQNGQEIVDTMQKGAADEKELASNQTVEIEYDRVLGDTTTMDLDTGIRAAITKGTRYKLVRDIPDKLVVNLNSGSAWFVKSPDTADKILIIKTPSGEIAVKGTVLYVDVHDRRVRVKVLRGTVEVTDTNNKLWQLSGGQALTLGKTNLEELDRCQVEEDWEALAMSGLSSSRPTPDEKEDQRDTSETSPPAETLEMLHQRIGALRLERDWPAVSQAYSSLIANHQGTMEAGAAMVALGFLNLEKLGNPTSAIRWFEQYLGTNSPTLAPEALIGKARALRALGAVEGETAALEAFLSQYPDEPHAVQARQRLKAISQSPKE